MRNGVIRMVGRRRKGDRSYLERQRRKKDELALPEGSAPPQSLPEAQQPLWLLPPG